LPRTCGSCASATPKRARSCDEGDAPKTQGDRSRSRGGRAESHSSLVWMFVRGSSGRRRYNVLGAWNGITRELIRVTNDTRVSSDTTVEILGRIAGQTRDMVTVVLDNARYQRCEAVETEAKRLGIELLFLPSYSPNLNLIECLWKFTKRKALRGKHYPDFATFLGAIDDCLNRIHTDHREALALLMTLKFQTFDNASFLAA
jgi:hypothetical protein